MGYSGLVDPQGRPLRSTVTNKKEAPPALGNSHGRWAGRNDLDFLQLPGGGVVAFDLSKLTLSDFRQMRDHYQINASLSVLSFMQHQSDWHIEHEDKKIADFCTEQIANNWTGLNRTLAQANWAGYSPAALEWENEGRRIVLDKIKDLVPEECEVNWREEKGWAPPGRTPPTFLTYDGIKQIGAPWPIPVENSLWYPLLMENGNYAGRKLLRPAFTSWFFSILLHLFANRYYERFGEPVPVGRAPFDEEIDIDGNSVRGNNYMLKILQDLRNRSVIVLPNTQTEDSSGKASFDYDLEYLESQMRGADFERYLTRLDEEMSIGLFTPILLMRTADVGSYNLGVGHMQVYLWMLNAMNDDRKVYIDKYLLAKMKNYNFGVNSPPPKIVFRKMGNSNAEMVKELLTALVQGNKAMVDLEELGQMAGMTLKEVRQTTAPAPEPDAEDGDGQEDPNADDGGTADNTGRAGTGAVRDVVKDIVARVRPQVESAYRSFEDPKLSDVSMGYKRKMERAFAEAGDPDPIARVHEFYERMDSWIANADTFSHELTPGSFMSMFEKTADMIVTPLVTDRERSS